MAKAEVIEAVDGFLTLLSGMNSGMAPSLIKADSYALGINLTSRGGLVCTRPGFTQEPVVLPPGTFQGAGQWSLHSGDRIVMVISGRLISLRTDTLAITDFGVKFDATAQCFFCQADRYFLVQDGTSPPVVLEEVAGADVIKVLPALDTHDPDPATWVVPVWAGYIMAYVFGRIHMVPRFVPHTTENGRPYFISGDILDPTDSSTILSFTEDIYFAGGGATGMPLECGYIYGMGSFRNSTTGTGYGPLIVFGRRGVAAFDVTVDRAQWGTANIGQMQFFGPGTVSPWAIVSVNDDLAYRAGDGIRFLKYVKTTIGGTSGAVSDMAQSAEVSVYMDTEPAAFLPYVSAAMCNNRLFVTALGVNDRYFRGMVVLDAAQVSAMRSTEAPAYDGLWQIANRNIGQILSAYRQDNYTLFVITEGPELWRLDESATQDSGPSDIACRLITRVMPFQVNGQGNLDCKILQYAELWFSDLRTAVDVTPYFRPSGYPLWMTAGTRHLDIPAGSLPQRRRGVRWNLFDSFSQICDPALKENLGVGQGFQFAIDWTGHLKIEAFRAMAIMTAEEPPLVCDESGTDAVAAGPTAGVELGDYLT